MTIRSGCMKSAIAEPSRRNSGLETTCTAWSERLNSRMIAATRSPVSTGTVDLLTTSLGPSSASAISRATARTYAQIGEPRREHRRSDGDEHDLCAADAARDVARERQPLAGAVARDEFGQPRFVERDAAGGERLEPRRVVLDADDLIPEFRETRPRHQADVAATDNRDSMQAGPPGLDVLFVAAHLLTTELSSGGDQLFANTAREIAREHPEWHIGVVAPDYACDGLAPFFRTVIAAPSRRSRRARSCGRIARALIWWNRLRPAAAALDACGAAARPYDRRLLRRRPRGRARRPRAHAAVTGPASCITSIRRRLRRRNDAADGGRVVRVCRPLSLRALRRSLRTHLAAQRRDARARSRGAGSRANGCASSARASTPRASGSRPPPARRAARALGPPARADQGRRRLAAARSAARAAKRRSTLSATGRAHMRDGSAARARPRRASRTGCALHGYVDDATLVDLYARANAFVSCSYEEGWGISLCEALAVGVPCARVRAAELRVRLRRPDRDRARRRRAALARRIDGSCWSRPDECAPARGAARRVAALLVRRGGRAAGRDLRGTAREALSGLSTAHATGSGRRPRGDGRRALRQRRPQARCAAAARRSRAACSGRPTAAPSRRGSAARNST